MESAGEGGESDDEGKEVGEDGKDGKVQGEYGEEDACTSAEQDECRFSRSHVEGEPIKTGENGEGGDGGDSGGEMVDGESMFRDGEESAAVIRGSTGEHTTDIGVCGDMER